MRALPLVHEAGGLMVGTGARTRLRTHEVEPSREFLRCLPVARALSPPPGRAVMRARARSGGWF